MKVLVVGSGCSVEAVRLACSKEFVGDIAIVSPEQVNEAFKSTQSFPITNVHEAVKAACYFAPRKSDNQPWKKPWKK